MTGMKKLMPLLALFVLLAGCTGGCVAGEQPPADTPAVGSPTPKVTPTPEVTPRPTESAAVPSPTPSPTPLPVESQIPAPTPEPSPTATPIQRPGDAEVLEAYQQAAEVFSWFHLATLPVDSMDRVELDGAVYARVEFFGIASMADLRGALKRLFSDELVDYLLPAAGTQYRDVDGVLYVQEGARGTDITKGGEQRQVIWLGDESCNVQVTVEVLDPAQDFAASGSESHTFPYQKVGSDWIFTNFYLVR